MLKKRLIFTLLWAGGDFCLSRNFRLQHVGGLPWLTQQYNFATLAESIDELALIDVTRGPRQTGVFLEVVAELAASFHMPLTVGGGILTPIQAHEALRAGADRVIINSGLSTAPGAISEMVATLGAQCIVGSVDARNVDGRFHAFIHDGEVDAGRLSHYLMDHVIPNVGEILLNNVERDGTGRGLDLSILDQLPEWVEQPVDLMGGAGRPEHLAEALASPRVDAVATSNLLNFLGTGLGNARRACEVLGVPLPVRIPTVGNLTRLSPETAQLVRREERPRC